jgi:signal transduction histidine kinase
MQITIEDDGVGLPAAVVPNVGLHSMRERAEELGGIISVTATSIRRDTYHRVAAFI